MRKAPALTATLLTLALAPPPAAAVPAPTLSDAQRQRLACDFGETVIRNLDAQSLMDLEPVAPAEMGPPDDPLVAAWRSRGPTNLLTACPHLKDRLPAGVRFATADDHAEAARAIGARPVFITRFAAPYVSPDGQQMLHVQTWKCPSLCGGYVLSRLRRKGAGWGAPEILAMLIA